MRSQVDFLRPRSCTYALQNTVFFIFPSVGSLPAGRRGSSKLCFLRNPFGSFFLSPRTLWWYAAEFFFRSRSVVLEKQAGCTSAFSICDPRFVFTRFPATVPATQTGTCTASFVHIRTPVCPFMYPPIHIYIHTYQLMVRLIAIIAKLQSNFWLHTVTAEALSSVEAAGELQRAEELIINAAVEDGWLGHGEEEHLPSRLEGRLWPHRQNDRLLPSGQRDPDTKNVLRKTSKKLCCED